MHSFTCSFTLVHPPVIFLHGRIHGSFMLPVTAPTLPLPHSLEVESMLHLPLDPNVAAPLGQE